MVPNLECIPVIASAFSANPGPLGRRNEARIAGRFASREAAFTCSFCPFPLPAGRGGYESCLTGNPLCSSRRSQSPLRSRLAVVGRARRPRRLTPALLPRRPLLLRKLRRPRLLLLSPRRPRPPRLPRSPLRPRRRPRLLRLRRPSPPRLIRRRPTRRRPLLRPRRRSKFHRRAAYVARRASQTHLEHRAASVRCSRSSFVFLAFRVTTRSAPGNDPSRVPPAAS